MNHIGGVMVSMLASRDVDHGFKPWLCQTKDYKIGICCSSNKHTALRNKSKDWLDMLSECRDMILGCDPIDYYASVSKLFMV